MKYLIAALALSLAAACSTTKPPTTIKEYDSSGKLLTETADAVQPDPYTQYLAKATEQHSLVELTCPPTGCVMSSFKVFQPGSANLAPPPGPPEPWGLTLTKVLGNVAVSVVPWVAGAKVLHDAFGHASNINGSYNATTTAPNTTTSTVNTTNTRNANDNTTTTNSNNNSSTNNPTTTTTTNPPASP